MPHKSAFTKSARSSSEVVHLDPVKRQFLTLTTVGLNRLFNKIQNGEDNVIHGRTDGRGRYCPVIGEVLADKYKITNSLSTQGQSAIIVKAKDLNLEGVDVIIKILHINYYKIGIQESHLLSRLKSADPYLVSHTVKLNTTFKHDRHYCMVFEALNPEPITTVFTSKSWDVRTRLSEIRKLTGKLLQVLSFLKQQNTIHADLKPDNILLKNSDVRSVRVIDFGNAIHHVHQEVSMYYEKFEIQTLLYRAPEVLFGIPFGTEIDMWSLGCILAELFLGKPLFMGLNKQDLVYQISEILGRFPAVIFQRGKFYQDLSQFTGDNTQNDATLMILSQLPGCYDYMFANFLAELLKFDPDKRLCPLEALQHPFMAAEFNMGVTLQAQITSSI